MSDDVSYAQAKKEFEDANYGVGSNLDNFFLAVTGQKKNFSELPPKNGSDNSAANNEAQGVSMFEDEFIEGLAKTASIQLPTPQTEDQPVKHTASELTNNQKIALANYPGLIDYIGQADEEIVDVIGEALNGYIVKKVAENSNNINKAACMCKSEGKALKQYFQYPDIVGCVTVEGKFTGKEYIHHKKAEQECLVLVKRNDKFYNVSKNFNIDYSFAAITE